MKHLEYFWFEYVDTLVAGDSVAVCERVLASGVRHIINLCNYFGALVFARKSDT